MPTLQSVAKWDHQSSPRNISVQIGKPTLYNAATFLPPPTTDILQKRFSINFQIAAVLMKVPLVENGAGQSNGDLKDTSWNDASGRWRWRR